MQKIYYRVFRTYALTLTIELAVTNIQVAKTAASFQTIYNFWNNNISYYNYNR